MLERIPNLPANVVGITASGQVSAKDYETVFIPAIESAIKEHGSIRILYQLGPAYTGFTAGALFDDMKVGIKHLKAWEKIAMVTDVEWIASAARIFMFAMPCAVRTFHNNEMEEAVRWIA